MAPAPSSEIIIKMQAPPGPGISDLYKANSPEMPEVFADAMDVRMRVFIHEQGCSAEEELDDDDPRSWQWVGYLDSRPIACIRLVPPPHAPHPNGVTDERELPYVKLTRMAVTQAARGSGLARRMCELVLGWAIENAELVGNGWKGLVLVHAQVRVEKVWERLGFKTDESLGRWGENDIEHLGMWRQLDLTPGPSK